MVFALALIPTSAFAQAKTSIKFTSDKNPAIAGEFVVFTAHLVWTGAVAPTGVIQIRKGSQLLAELTPVSDETWHTNILAPGIHKLRAFYLGDANYAASASGTYWQAICSCPLQITTASLPDGVVGEPYEAQLEAVGGDPPYSWSMADGVLPPGLSLASDGKITGTPTSAGRWKLPARLGRELALTVHPDSIGNVKPARTQAKPRRR